METGIMDDGYLVKGKRVVKSNNELLKIIEKLYPVLHEVISDIDTIFYNQFTEEVQKEIEYLMKLERLIIEGKLL